MLRWIPYALVRITLFFTAGILLAIHGPENVPLQFVLYLLLAGLAVYAVLFLWQRINPERAANPGFIGLCLILMLGYVHTRYQADSEKDNSLLQLQDTVHYYRATVSSQPQQKERSWKLEAHVDNVKTTAGWKNYEGRVLLYFPRKEFAKPFRYGDVLLIKGQYQPVPAPGNPGEFDYRTYLRYRKIHHQHFIKSGSVQVIENNPKWYILKYAIDARIRADSIIHHHVSGAREQAIASALVLGVTDGLDNELLGAYAATGAMHVLSVSGLHISIVYMIILWLLRPLNKTVSGKWILAVISVVILWGYAFVTGGSPSVLRAVVMFTFMAVARASQRNSNIYNVLASSAFCLLLFEPYYIMSVGFQLSYLAVFGIVYLQPPLYRLWEAKTWLGNEVWKITSVSLAAQAATLSLGFLYFHQFPNYFLLANLLVIPGSFVVLIAGIVLLVVSFISPVAWLVGIVLQMSIQILNFVVFTIEAFPFSLLEGIYISTFQSCIIMAGLASMVLLIQFRKIVFLYSAVLFSGLYAVAQWNHHRQTIHQKQFIVYKVPGHTALDFIDRGQTLFHTDSLLLADQNKIHFHIEPNRLIHGVGHVVTLPASASRSVAGANLWYWNNQSIVQVYQRDFQPSQTTIDILIISQNAPVNLAALVKTIKPRMIILDSSNSYYFASELLRQSEALRIPVHSVWHHGAYAVSSS
jgi:competence protein ComEC